jgi:glucose-6-phosphate isomerase
MSLTSLPEWADLKDHHEFVMAGLSLRSLFAADKEEPAAPEAAEGEEAPAAPATKPSRFQQFNQRLSGAQQFEMLFDYSKNKINKETMDKLFALAKARNVEGFRDQLLGGGKLNKSEDKAVCHTQLRSPNPAGSVSKVQEEMKEFARLVRNGEYTMSKDAKVKDVVNIGIGGSHLGPEMVNNALKNYAGDIKVHFVSNVDGAHLARVLGRLASPESTLFIVTCRSFKTNETMLNVATAQKWLLRHVPDADISKNFVAVTQAGNFDQSHGITKCFEIPFWVPGRFSIWSAVGLSVAINIGWGNFKQFLDGAANMDEHFASAPLDQNIPIIMALIGVWYRNFFNCPAHAILPYDQALSKFAQYWQQGDMESNGKSLTNKGAECDYATGPVIWGETGTNGQHAFHQLLHQGTDMIPADFLVFAKACEDEKFIPKQHHDCLISNCLAQTMALMNGRTSEEVNAAESRGAANAFMVHKGDKPTNTILVKKLNPYSLGNIMAMYEHKIAIQGCIWDINSFDRLGVEYGKTLAEQILPSLDEQFTDYQFDSSTNGLIQYIKELQVFNPF